MLAGQNADADLLGLGGRLRRLASRREQARRSGDDDHPDQGARSYADLSVHRAWAERLYPGREIHFLMLGCPITTGMDVIGHNAFLAEEIAKDPKVIEAYLGRHDPDR